MILSAPDVLCYLLQVTTTPARSPSGELYPSHRVLTQSSPELAAGLLLGSWRLSKQQQQQRAEACPLNTQSQEGTSSEDGLHGVMQPTEAAAGADVVIDLSAAAGAGAAGFTLVPEGADDSKGLGRIREKLRGASSSFLLQKQGVHLALEKVHQQLLAMEGPYGSSSITGSSSSGGHATREKQRAASSGSRSQQGWDYAEEWCLPKTNKQYRKWNLRGLQRDTQIQQVTGAVKHQQQQQNWMDARVGSLLTLPQQFMQGEGGQWGVTELNGRSEGGKSMSTWGEEDVEDGVEEGGLTQAQLLVHKVLVEAGLTLE